MNEEPKSGTLSSGLVQAMDKQDDHSTFVMPGDLNNFLIRRQLLGMESKTIQDLLLEAAGELKAKQDHLVDVRDRVLAALRDHLAHLDELARVEFLTRQRLENLNT